MTHQPAFIRRADGKVIIADVVEKARVDQLLKAIRLASDLDAVLRLVDEFEGEK